MGKRSHFRGSCFRSFFACWYRSILHSGGKCSHILLFLIISFQLGATTFLAMTSSPTLDEPAHIASGVEHWRTGTFNAYKVNPPLVRLLASLPVVFLSDFACNGVADEDATRTEFFLGYRFFEHEGRQAVGLLRIGRLVLLPLPVLGTLICFLWSMDLFGRRAAVAAAAMWAFNPLVLGHGALLTPDVHASSLGCAACYVFWVWMKDPRWIHAVSSGVVLGLAELAKTTMLILLPLWPVIWFCYRCFETKPLKHSRLLQELTMILARLVIALYVVNLGYNFQESLKPLGDFNFNSQLLTSVGTNGASAHNIFGDGVLAELPAPFPGPYITGIDLQQFSFENDGRPAYLRGVHRSTGWYYYYLYALLVKLPLGTVCLVLFGIAIVAAGLKRVESIILIAPLVTILTIASMKTGINAHTRYIIPCFPFLFILASACFHRPRTQWACIPAALSGMKVRLVLRALPTCLLASALLASVSSFPNCISFFNIAAGGGPNGPRHLLGSNVDWGQDLLKLDPWIEANGAQRNSRVFFAGETFYNPYSILEPRCHPWPWLWSGIGNEPNALDSQLKKDARMYRDDFFAISVNILFGSPDPIRNRQGVPCRASEKSVNQFRRLDPIDKLGDSIYIFSGSQLENDR